MLQISWIFKKIHSKFLYCSQKNTNFFLPSFLLNFLKLLEKILFQHMNLEIRDLDCSSLLQNVDLFDNPKTKL